MAAKTKMEKLQELLGEDDTERGNVTVRKEGTKIILPTGMTNKQAIEWLKRKEEEEQKVVAIVEQVNTHPLDGAIAFMKALKEKYGWTNLAPTPGFFGANPPTLMSVKISATEEVQIPWGRVQIPGISGYIETGFAVTEGRVIFQLSGQTRQGEKDEVHALANLTRTIAATDSIYKGKAIMVDFPDLDDYYGPFDHAPKFIDTRKTNEEDLIFPENVQALVETTLFTPIRKTVLCRNAKIPLKRGILLEGPFGVGKTLTAAVTAALCEQNGWTYIYIEDVRQLASAVKFARQYEPAVIFAEDIDRASNNDKKTRDAIVNGIMNTIDGVEIKNAEIIVVVTTNDVHSIEPAMLRPGRLDAVIPVRPPDAQAAIRLVKLFAGPLLEEGSELTEVGEMLAGKIPAVIREVVERSKLAAIARSTDGTLFLNGEDLRIAAEGMIAHLKLLEPKPVDKRSDAEKAAAIVADGMSSIAAAVAIASSQQTVLK